MKDNDKLILYLDNHFMRSPGVIVIESITLLLFGIYVLFLEPNQLSKIILFSIISGSIAVLASVLYINGVIRYTYKYSTILLPFIDIQISKYPNGWWSPTDPDSFNSKKTLPNRYAIRVIFLLLGIVIFMSMIVVKTSEYLGNYIYDDIPKGLHTSIVIYAVGVFFLSVTLFWKYYYRKIYQKRL